MLVHLSQTIGAHTAGLSGAADLLGFALTRALRLPLALPYAVRTFLLAWLTNAALKLAPAMGGPRLSVDENERDARGSFGTGRANARRRCASSAPAALEASAPRIYVDLTDVLCHAIWHDTCAGIPRVQLEIATRLFSMNPAVCLFGLHRKKWCELGALLKEADGDIDKAFALLKETFSDFKFSREGVRRLITRRRRRLPIPHHASMPDVKAQDSLFIGGAFWLNKGIADLCERTAANSANLIVLFHDLIPLSMPAFTGHDFSRQYREALRLPAHFVVTTELNRSELKRARREIDQSPARTCSSVVPLADEFPGSERNERAGLASPRLAILEGRDFVLCVGTIEIRKNHHALLGVWNELAEERGAALPKLVVAGRRGWKAEATLMQLEALAQGGPVVFIEAPTDDELRWLYASCLFTAFPSFFEGWGLPVGESFWFGKPCAASNSKSIAPVARDLCVSFSPHHREDMKEALQRLLNPSTRRLFQRRIEAAPLRRWSEVATDIETLIAERRPVSDPLTARAEVSPLESSAA
ncbi:Glycosyl transferase group 1 [Methylocella tundrae]|uniref:Glycosyl transferase group 1 n=1 Tax=Methylocella tundrae TaxID=227605 RepID=A0A8B6M2B3_METTU|nr:glycosyltransferase [Methylocella tundrae]VTZ48914.1 Glycosyl transferase group 1 [Methylocella tundrae]